MFFRQNSADVDAIAKTLIGKGGPDGFRVLHHIFPDSPRDMNDNFVALTLWTLIKFENSGIQVSWLPSWLVAPSQPADVEGAIRQLIALGVTTLDAEPKRKLVLQYSACARRIPTIALVHIPIAAKIGRASCRERVCQYV